MIVKYLQVFESLKVAIQNLSHIRAGISKKLNRSIYTLSYLQVKKLCACMNGDSLAVQNRWNQKRDH